MRSSVLGGIIIGEVMDHGSLMGSDPNRYENRSYVYLNGARLAFQQHINPTGPNEEVVWVNKNPVIGSLLENNKLNYEFQGQVQPLELSHTVVYTDPLGSDLGIDPATLPPPPQ